MARSKRPSGKPAPEAQSPLPNRVRNLLALDAANVMGRLARRQGEIVALFSRLRDREALLAMVESWFPSIAFGELVALEPHEQDALNVFYQLLAELRWYLRYTEDMPLQLQQQLLRSVRDVEASYGVLRTVMGTTAAVPETAKARRRVKPPR